MVSYSWTIATLCSSLSKFARRAPIVFSVCGLNSLMTVSTVSCMVGTGGGAGATAGAGAGATAGAGAWWSTTIACPYLGPMPAPDSHTSTAAATHISRDGVKHKSSATLEGDARDL